MKNKLYLIRERVKPTGLLFTTISLSRGGEATVTFQTEKNKKSATSHISDNH